MKHHKAFRKFGREKNQRKAFVRGLLVNLIRNGRIETTLARAKEIRPFVEKLVTLAKEDTVSRRRLVMSRLMNQAAETGKLFSEYAPKFKEVTGGYTRIIKLPTRLSDGAEKAVIEFV
ncbi:MAG: 50S ribosomal protein L17 [Candidatus Paceibacterota bacterium]|jgi:large subunit ribosomal protein L17